MRLRRWLVALLGPQHPVDRDGRPDLSTFHESPGTYRRRHRDAVRDGDFTGRALASWGLIARGSASVPDLLEMLDDPASEVREDAAGALASLGKEAPHVVEALLRTLTAATTDEERDTVIGALGALRNEIAVPGLAAVVRDPAADPDTRVSAAEALGQVVRRRFDQRPDPLAAALQWLDDHPGRAAPGA